MRKNKIVCVRVCVCVCVNERKRKGERTSTISKKIVVRACVDKLLSIVVNEIQLSREYV